MKRATFKYFLIFILSYLGLLGERLWNQFWLVISCVLFFSGLALLNIPLLLGTVGHLLFLSCFFLVLLGLICRAIISFSWPSRTDVKRQIEKVSALSHRPLETLQDRPIENLSSEAQELWHKHLQKTAEYIQRLKIYKPRTTVASRDRYALRYAAVIFLAAGLIAARQDARLRLQHAFTPDMNAVLNQKTAALDLWITPPTYTHDPVIFLATSKQGILPQSGVIQVTEGSILKLRLSGYRFAPRLNYAGTSYRLTETAPHNFTLEMTLQQSSLLSLRQWLASIGEWSVTVAPDMPPAINITKIETTPLSAVKINYTPQDDHGIAKLTGIIRPAEEKTGSTTNTETRFNIPLSSTSGEAVHIQDLTAHVLAGLPVALTIEAEDAVGHKSISAPYALILPERQFTNPVAQRLIAERKSLLQSDNLLVRRTVAENIAAIASDLSLYKGDIVIFMSLSVAAKRLAYSDDIAVNDSVQDILWNVALKLEDGGLSLAQRELHDTLQKMTEALNDKNLSKQQLQEILDEAQRKMQQYIQALATELQQRLQQGKKVPALSPELAQKFMQNIDIAKLVEQMRQLSQGNSRENLKKIAENLRNTIDNLDMKKFDQMQEKQMRAMAALQNLEDIIRRQQILFDKTNKAEDSDTPPKEQKQEQSSIRRQLGDALRALGETISPLPENFVKADQSMKLSEEAFAKNLPRDTLPLQKTAIEELQKGMDDTIKQMAQTMQQSLLSFGQMGGSGQGYDPLGRQSSGASDDSSVKLPNEKEQRRVQEIIKELRNRSNEPNRTKVERDYIDRLLDQF